MKLKKMLRKLKKRQEAYDQVTRTDQDKEKKYTRPGSMNPRKR